MNKKIYNFHTEFSCFAVIKPLTPRFSALDGVMSVLNTTGDYYRVDANIKNLCKASERITKLNDVWQVVGRDICRATDIFARTNDLCNIKTNRFIVPKLPKHLE